MSPIRNPTSAAVAGPPVSTPLDDRDRCRDRPPSAFPLHSVRRWRCGWVDARISVSIVSARLPMSCPDASVAAEASFFRCHRRPLGSGRSCPRFLSSSGPSSSSSLLLSRTSRTSRSRSDRRSDCWFGQSPVVRRTHIRPADVFSPRRPNRSRGTGLGWSGHRLIDNTRGRRLASASRPGCIPSSPGTLLPASALLGIPFWEFVCACLFALS